MPTASAQVTFRVVGVSKIALSVSSISSPVQVGQNATATLVISNSGSAAANVTVSATTSLGSTQEGTWASKTVTVNPGQSVTVSLQTSGPLNSQFAGDTMTAKFLASY